MKVNPWFVLALSVVAIDAVALVRKTPTLSATFYDAVRHPVRRWPVTLAWSLVTVHLFTGKP